MEERLILFLTLILLFIVYFTLSYYLVDHSEGIKLNFVKFPTTYANAFFNFVKGNALLLILLESNLEKEFGYREGSEVTCTGGGSYKYREIVQELFKLNINIVDEMKSIASGVDFLLRTQTNEVFSWEKLQGKSQPEKVFLKHPEVLVCLFISL